MAHERHVKLLRHDINAWNGWREKSPEIRPDLSGANLGWANLMQVNLVGANLSGADLSVADLEDANLSQANLSGANLSNANLSRANLSRVNLSQANLSGGNLSGANLSESDLSQTNCQWANLLWANLSQSDLSGADLSGANVSLANFSDAIMAYTVFGDLDLSEAKGLENTHHRGPSTIGIDTIYRSNGQISAAFLRGAGVPDAFINYVASLTSEATQYHSCFISYVSQDEPFARQLYSDLQENGVRCWYAPENLNIGAKIRPTIDESVRVHDKLLLVVSEHSVGNRWIEQEVEAALAQEQKISDTVLFALRLDDAILEAQNGWPALINEMRQIGDFSQWQNVDTYQQAFEQLLQDLKAE